TEPARAHGLRAALPAGGLPRHPQRAAGARPTPSGPVLLMILRGWGSRRRRRAAALSAAPPGPLRDHLATAVPGPSTHVARLPLPAVDIETTGLDAEHDRVLAVGWVPVDGLAIDLSGSRRLVLGTRTQVGQSATVHGLTDDVVAAGVIPEEGLVELLRAL